MLSGYLMADGFEVIEATTGEDAVARVRRRAPDLVLLDVMLPDVDGIEVLRRIRTFSDVYIVLVTARAEETDTLVGLAVGADDYITKPFSPREVVARVKAVLRRGRGQVDSPARLVFDGLTIDPAAREVALGDRSVRLSALEFDLLVALGRAPGRVFSRQQLVEQVWGGDFYGDERVVDVHIRNLRKQLDDDAAAPAIIGTVRGVGYKFLLEPR
ncbi:response regulator transcription factor [Actinotalea sp. K2]|uniref:winged helix-turn-helix domain-containing protein n=1 Tax=Actinotalea sp. K2 TaxID=2939438 RepID=UPI002016FD57